MNKKTFCEAQAFLAAMALAGDVNLPVLDFTYLAAKAKSLE